MDTMCTVQNTVLPGHGRSWRIGFIRYQVFAVNTSDMPSRILTTWYMRVSSVGEDDYLPRSRRKVPVLRSQLNNDFILCLINNIDMREWNFKLLGGYLMC